MQLDIYSHSYYDNDFHFEAYKDGKGQGRCICGKIVSQAKKVEEENASK